MTKKTMLSAAVAIGAVKGYQLLGKRYGDLLPSKEQYLIPEGTQPITVHTSIGDFRLVASSGYYGGKGIFVYAKNLVDPDAFNREVLRGDSIVHTHIVPVVTEELTAAFLEATNRQFHLDIPPHTCSGGDSNAFALITADTTNGFNPDAPTMRMAARTLRTILDGSLLDRTKNFALTGYDTVRFRLAELTSKN